MTATGWPGETPSGIPLAITIGGRVEGFLAIAGGEARAELTAVWLRAEARRRGYGVEAVRLVVGALEGKATEVRAFAPAEVGLFVYFWLRLGFRPMADRAPAEGLGFVRRLA